MKLKKVLIFSLIISFLANCLVAIKPTPSFSQPSLGLNLSLDKPFYLPEDQFTLTTKLTNLTKEEIGRAKITVEIGKRLEVPSLKKEAKGEIKFKQSLTKDLPPGETTLEIIKKISRLKISEGAYRISVTVSQNNIPIVSENTALVVVDSHTAPVLATTLVWNFHERASFDENGVFQDSKIIKEIKSDFENPGFYFAHLNALFNHPDISVTLNLSPLLIYQLTEIGNGFKVREKNDIKEFGKESEESENARRLLEEMEGLIKSERVEIAPGPFANLSLFNLTKKTWQDDIFFQIQKGRETVVHAFNLEENPRGIYFPYLKASLKDLRFPMALQIRYTVLCTNTLSEESEIKDTLFSPLETVDTKGNKFIIFFSDTAILEEINKHKDPESAAQTIIGLLAEIYLHDINKQRLIVLAAENPYLRADQAFLEALYGKIEQVPWLKTITLNQAEELLAPSSSLPDFKQNLEKNPEADEYYRKIEIIKKDHETFSKMIPLEHPLQEKLLNNLLIAESSDWLGSENSQNLTSLGLNFANSILKTIEKELAKISVVDNQIITLTSRQGKIPIIVNNETGYLVKATIELSAEDVQFPSENSIQTVLSPKQNTFTFPVEVRVKKPSPITVTLHYNGKVITKSTVIIKTTLINESIRNLAIAFLLIICLLLGWRYVRKTKKRLKP